MVEVQRHMAIARRSVAAQVYDHIRGAILNDEYPPGSKVVEARIARELGISRAPVREAVQRLVNDGLIDTVPGQGHNVISFDVEDIRELYLLRVHVEELAITQVIHRRAGGVGELQRILRTIERAAARGAAAEVAAAELRFHERMVEMSGNRFLCFVYDKIAAFVRIALNIDNAQFANLADVAAEHEPIIDVIQRQDAAAAPAVIRQHVLASLSNFDRADDGEPRRSAQGRRP